MESDSLRWVFSFVLKILCCQHDKDGTEDETFETSLENGGTSALQVSHGHGFGGKGKINGTGTNGKEINEREINGRGIKGREFKVLL